MKNPTQIKNKLILAPAAIVLFVVFVLAVSWLFDKREEYAFRRISMDIPESAVVALMGAPNRVTGCGEYIWWEDENRGTSDGLCVKEDHYDHMFNSWTVGYSAKHRVVSKHHDASPKH